MDRFIIIKELILPNGQKQPAVFMTNQDEIWEFTSFEEADNIAKTLEKNSDSGWKYKVKIIKG